MKEASPPSVDNPTPPAEAGAATVVAPKLSIIQKIGLFVASIAPGLFLLGYNIGTGSITTAAATGAQYGMSLIWPLLLSCLFTFVLIVAFGRYTVVTGKTALTSYREYFGTGLAFFVLLSLLVSEWVSSMGVMGVVTQVVQEWSRPLTSSGNGFSPVWMAIIFGALVYALFWNGTHRFFERVLIVFVSLMGLSFILSMFMVIPDAGDVIAGMVPSIPEDSNAALLIAGMVGTTMGGILYVVRSILVQEKGWTLSDIKHERRDATISATMMFVLSVAVMACAAGTLYPLGLRVENAIDMVSLLEPLAGRFAVSIFVAGIVCAGLSSFFPIVLLAPWLIADFRNKPRDMRAPSARLLVLFGVCLGLVVPVFGGRPVLVMIVSQALAAVVTPLVVFMMLVLQNNRKLMGIYKASTMLNVTVGIILLFTLFMAALGIFGISGLLRSYF